MGKLGRQIPGRIVRFAGDSGDGMQLIGARFIAGTLPRVSSFQIHFADHDTLTPATSRTCWWR